MTRLDFFARIAAVERATGQRVGADHPSDEPLRFAPPTELAFAATDARAEGRTWVTHFLALGGADGALPPYLRGEIAAEDPDRAPRRALLTPFHHRATALLHRSVHRCRLADEVASLDDVWPRRLAALVRPGTDDRDARETALALAPLLHGGPSGASLRKALQVIARRWLDGAPITLTERSAGRVPVRASRLGRARLGDDALLGRTVLDPAGRATIDVGPLPAGTHLDRALGAIALAVGWLADPAVEVDLVLAASDEPLRLGGARLGAVALGTPRRPRARRVALGATMDATCREGQRTPEERPCAPTPARSSSV